MRFCFIVGLSAAAVQVLSAGSLPNTPQRITSVVRSDNRTGKLVRSTVVSSHSVGQRTLTQQVIAPKVISPIVPAAELPEPPVFGPPSNVTEAVDQIAAQHALPPALLHSVIKVESNYNPLAISPKGAQGLMQLIPSTARRFGVNNVFNPVENIQGGAKYLRYLLDLYNGNYPLALAAYNAGEAAVARFGGVPPFRETQNYLVLVRQQLEAARRAEATKQREKEKVAEAKPESGPAHIQEVVGQDGTVRYVSR